LLAAEKNYSPLSLFPSTPPSPLKNYPGNSPASKMVETKETCTATAQAYRLEFQWAGAKFQHSTSFLSRAFLCVNDPGYQRCETRVACSHLNENRVAAVALPRPRTEKNPRPLGPCAAIFYISRFLLIFHFPSFKEETSTTSQTSAHFISRFLDTWPETDHGHQANTEHHNVTSCLIIAGRFGPLFRSRPGVPASRIVT
jgi:hypothetical protein